MRPTRIDQAISKLEFEQKGGRTAQSYFEHQPAEMTMVQSAQLPPKTMADLVHRLGDVPLDRIRLQPAPGTASAADVLRLLEREPKAACELVEGVLVEKVMGFHESRLAALLIWALQDYLNKHDIGIVVGADAPFRILTDQVRLPDVAFISYSRIPAESRANPPVPEWVPTLAVEIISGSNTAAEMTRKLEDYFRAGVELVWYVEPSNQTVRVYRSPSRVKTLAALDDLDGEEVLPGFRLSIGDWFERASRLRPQ